MVVAALGPHDAWVEPILRLGDTVVGVLVGIGAATVLGWASGQGDRGRRRRWGVFLEEAERKRQSSR
jgi:hypothetical protein